MKWKQKSSKSVYKAILQVGQPETANTGLRIHDRFFVPDTVAKKHSVFWWMMDAQILLCLAFGLYLLVTTGFSLGWDPLSAFAVLAESLGALFLFRSSWCQKHWKVLCFAGILLWFVLLFLFQGSFVRGAMEVGSQIKEHICQVYQGEFIHTESLLRSTDACIFFAFIFWPIACWLTFSLLIKNQFSMICLLVFPFVAVIALFGGATNIAALFLLLFGIIQSMAYQVTVRRRRMMGGKNKKLFLRNEKRFQNIQKQSAVLVLAGSIVISIFGFYLIRPFLAFSLAPGQKAAMKFQGALLGQVIRILPDITEGNYQLEVETVSGGVLDGSLQNTDGYVFHDLEDLSVTLWEKPTERLYLKGYIGSGYDGRSWRAPYEASFDGASLNWQTDSNARLFVQNLPFLRMSYVLRETDSDMEPIQISIERINANDAYTYVPYGAYLNDYYEVQSGDGAVTGQTEQEDRFYFYQQDEEDMLMKDWNLREDTSNTLDRTEESYAVYCKNQYLDISDGLEEIETQVKAIQKKKRWKSQENVEEISAWIRQFLAENYVYDKNVDPTAEREDFLRKFFLEEKRGYSIHFASAGVELYRMFGIPARYVVGYEVPETLFAVQPDGTYHAILQDDQSQAWTEIYINGLGWRPRDLTPGVIGTLEEVGEDGQKITTFSDPSEKKKKIQSEETPKEKKTPVLTAVRMYILGDLTVSQLIHGLTILVITALLLVSCVLILRRISWNYGLDLFRRRGNTKTALGIYHAICRRIHDLGLPSDVDTESERFWEFAEKQMRRNEKYQPDSLKVLSDKLYACCFGGASFTGEDIAALRKIYRQMPLKKQKSIVK